jgi:hypothetical protein
MRMGSSRQSQPITLGTLKVIRADGALIERRRQSDGAMADQNYVATVIASACRTAPPSSRRA